jgi:hypothetical protein
LASGQLVGQSFVNSHELHRVQARDGGAVRTIVSPSQECGPTTDVLSSLAVTALPMALAAGAAFIDRLLGPPGYWPGRSTTG